MNELVISKIKKERGFAIIKNVEDYDNYYCVSPDGMVVCPSYVDKSGNLRKTKILKQQKRGKGYRTVGLMRNGKQVFVSVHRLVAQTYIPNPYHKKEVNHIDGVKTNNSIENLEWVTASENALHAFETGLRKPKNQVGEKNSRAKLNWEKVNYIRSSVKTVGELASELNVSNSAIYKIKQNKRWIERE